MKYLKTLLLSLALIFSLSVSGAIVAQAQTSSTDTTALLEQINSLLALVASLQEQLAVASGGTATTNVSVNTSLFTRNLSLGDSGADVREMQKILNSDSRTRIADSGPGSPGNESDYFGALTQAALIRYQEIYSSEVLTPAGLTRGSGFFGSLTRSHMQSKSTIVTPSTDTTTTNTTTSTSGTESSGTTQTDASTPVIEVAPVPQFDPPQITFEASDIIIRNSDDLTLTWEVKEADTCRSSGFLAEGKLSGEITLSPLATNDYSLTCTGRGGTVTESIEVVVGSRIAPAVTISASREDILEGEEIQLKWDSINADRCSSDQFPSSGAEGSQLIEPEETIRYRITCENDDTGATTEESILIKVTPVLDMGPPDTDPPKILTSGPTTTFEGDTSPITLFVTTNEDAECRYSTTIGRSFILMNKFSVTGEMDHTAQLSDLPNFSTYRYYVRCLDEAENENPVDFQISFSIGAPPEDDE